MSKYKGIKKSQKDEVTNKKFSTNSNLKTGNPKRSKGSKKVGDSRGISGQPKFSTRFKFTSVTKKAKLALTNMGERIKKSPQDAKSRLSDLWEFIKSAFDELKKVEWLSRGETVRFGFYVLLFVIGGSILVAGLDFIFYEVLKFLTS